MVNAETKATESMRQCSSRWGPCPSNGWHLAGLVDFGVFERADLLTVCAAYGLGYVGELAPLELLG